jgi:hypothetical protein
VRALGDHYVRTGNLLGETERIHKAGQQDDPRVGFQLANPLDELASIHARHPIIGNHHVEGGALKEFQTLFTVSGDFDAIANLFEEASAYQQSVSIVVYQQDV